MPVVLVPAMVLAPVAYHVSVPPMADRLNVRPFDALAVVPFRLVRARVGLPCEWVLLAAVVKKVLLSTLDWYAVLLPSGIIVVDQLDARPKVILLPFVEAERLEPAARLKIGRAHV